MREMHNGSLFDSTEAMSLNWPDSADLLTSILSADFTNLPALEALPSQTVAPTESQSDHLSPWLTTDGNTQHRGTHAVQNLTQMINSLSADVTSEAQTTGFTTVFLDGCLHMFFKQFLPSMPVVHAATFVFKDWTHPLLLNAIALGSLFMGKKDYVLKGEILWRLAHTAVATSWQTLIKHRGPYDTCGGIQLVLTALLGQIYAMLSEVFHSLGFFWARWAGMYELEDQEEGIAFDFLDSHEVLERKWRVWAARETQLRALLGHYVLDGQISMYSGGPTCQRHTSHSLPMPTEADIFEATDAETWRDKMIARSQKRPPFAQLFSSVMSENVHVRHLGSSLALLTASVTLEGFKSFMAESPVSGTNVIGVPSRQDISRGLARFYLFAEQSLSMSLMNKRVTLLRWHTIGLDFAIDFNWFCRKLCQEYEVEQRIVGGRKKPPLDLESWLRSPKGRMGLLHAISIREIIQEIPASHAHTINGPMAVFSAAILYCGFLLGGISTISRPDRCSWDSILLLDIDTVAENIETDSDTQVRQYLTGTLSGLQRQENLLYEVNVFLTFLENLGRTWGVSTHMHRVVEQLVSRCGLG
ncbi:hypothetical protein PV08_11448 [Exophiala spinifera]|uniref:Xylanolytic transcriptional activator regulatory domain-containing protein n=1 Tax=Exophiala spinifera TaxID=91928 RepID=A0A0D2BGP4_9EURO|nr:uncharacterized protein PV08_11448 [Exophiala spinifera]KIW10484.1 hypothetical protein PV08_11448 [Exophiala spinifera]